jgi:hypothetical protein
MGMRFVGLREDRVYADFVAVEIAIELFPFGTESGEDFCVFSKEVLEDLFGFLGRGNVGVVFLEGYKGVVGPHVPVEWFFQVVGFVEPSVGF